MSTTGRNPLGASPGSSSDPLEVAFRRSRHGVLAEALLPARDRAPALVAALPAAERALCDGFGSARQVTFAAGRAVLRAAMCAVHGLEAGAPTTWAIGVDARGAPCLPAAVRGSLSHGAGCVVALVTPGFAGHVGVDVESIGRVRLEIAAKVLTEAEQAGLGREVGDVDLAVRFSIKEAIYKAIDPFVGRYIGFHEVEVWPRADGRAECRAELREGPFDVEAAWSIEADRVLTTVRAVRIVDTGARSL